MLVWIVKQTTTFASSGYSQSSKKCMFGHFWDYCCCAIRLEFSILLPHTCTLVPAPPQGYILHSVMLDSSPPPRVFNLASHLPVLCESTITAREIPAAGFGRFVDLYGRGGGRGLMGNLLPGNGASSTFVCQFCLLSPAAFTPTSSSTLIFSCPVALFLLLLLHPPPLTSKRKKHMKTVDVSFKCGANLTERSELEFLEGCSLKFPFWFLDYVMLRNCMCKCKNI